MAGGVTGCVCRMLVSMPGSTAMFCINACSGVLPGGTYQTPSPEES